MDPQRRQGLSAAARTYARAICWFITITYAILFGTALLYDTFVYTSMEAINNKLKYIETSRLEAKGWKAREILFFTCARKIVKLFIIHDEWVVSCTRTWLANVAVLAIAFCCCLHYYEWPWWVLDSLVRLHHWRTGNIPQLETAGPQPVNAPQDEPSPPLDLARIQQLEMRNERLEADLESRRADSLQLDRLKVTLVQEQRTSTQWRTVAEQAEARPAQLENDLTAAASENKNLQSGLKRANADAETARHNLAKTDSEKKAAFEEREKLQRDPTKVTAEQKCTLDRFEQLKKEAQVAEVAKSQAEQESEQLQGGLDMINEKRQPADVSEQEEMRNLQQEVDDAKRKLQTATQSAEDAQSNLQQAGSKIDQLEGEVRRERAAKEAAQADWERSNDQNIALVTRDIVNGPKVVTMLRAHGESEDWTKKIGLVADDPFKVRLVDKHGTETFVDFNCIYRPHTPTIQISALFSAAARDICLGCVPKSIVLCMDGQSGGGKTHTLLRDGEDSIFPALARDIFRHLERLGVEFNVEFSAFEIYCNNVFDLLNKGPSLVARNTQREISPTRKHVTTHGGLMQSMEQARKESHVSPTNFNKQSSRGNIVFDLVVTLHGTKRRIRVIDMAGMESKKGYEGHNDEARLKKEHDSNEKARDEIHKLVMAVSDGPTQLIGGKKVHKYLKDSIREAEKVFVCLCTRWHASDTRSTEEVERLAIKDLKSVGDMTSTLQRGQRKQLAPPKSESTKPSVEKKNPAKKTPYR